MAIPFLLFKIHERTSPLVKTGSPLFFASINSTFEGEIAVEYITASAFFKFFASWPIDTFISSLFKRFVYLDSFKSEPLTLNPMPLSTMAIALIPAPPIPVKK